MEENLIAKDDFSFNIAEDEEIKETCPPPVLKEDKNTIKCNISDKLIEKLPKVNKRALLKDSKTYRLEQFDRNAMIIFNQENIDGYFKREGSDNDALELKTTFEEFRFEVDVHKDLYRLDVSDKMYKFSHRDFTDYGCIAVAILTHGSEKGGLRAKDQKYKEKKILEFLRKNPTVVTKPIVYIIQACRGTREAEVNVVYAKKDDSKTINLYKLPQNADTLVLHSTYEGCFTHRDTNEGSWFIQTLCKKINQLADTEDMESIMTETKREIAIDKEFLEIDKITNKFDFNKQMPVTESTLIRKLYLKRRLIALLKDPEAITDVNELKSKEDRKRRNEKKRKEDLLENKNEKESVSNGKCKFCKETALERFEYIMKSLEFYIQDNPKDTKATGLMFIASNKEALADEDFKFEVAKLIRNFFFENTAGNANYKYIYIWKDLEE